MKRTLLSLIAPWAGGEIHGDDEIGREPCRDRGEISVVRGP